MFLLESNQSVDAMAAITLEELLEEVGVPPKKLNDSISDDHLRQIALFLTSWRTVATHLDLDENDLDDAEQGGRRVKDKSLKALQIWKGKFGFKATYGKLVEILLSLAMADVAEKICNLLKGMCSRLIIMYPVYVHAYMSVFFNTRRGGVIYKDFFSEHRIRMLHICLCVCAGAL